MTYTIGFLLFDDVDEPDFIGPLEVFNTSNDRAAKRGKEAANKTLLMSGTGKDIVGTSGVNISIDCALVDVPALDVLCLPGGRGIAGQVQNKQLLGEIAAIAPDCTWIACIGTGVQLATAAGLTGSEKLAPHISVDYELANPGGKSTVTTRQNYHRDGNLLTSNSTAAGIDMCLWLTGRLHSIPLALATQRAIDHKRQPVISSFG